jgi:hypothetical protein
MNVDMDANFEAVLTEQLGDDLQQGMSDYFTAIIKDMMERMENGEDLDFVDEDSPKEFQKHLKIKELLRRIWI